MRAGARTGHAGVPEVITIGETLLRLTAPIGEGLEQADMLHVHVAGAESNVAIGLSRLGVSSGWISRVVNSPLGRRIVNEARLHGVDVSRVIWTEDGRIAVYYLEIGRAPRPYRVVYDRKDSAFAHVDPEEIDWAYVRGGSLLHLSGITPALSPSCERVALRAVTEARAAGRSVSFDLNYRAKLWSTEEAWAVLSPLIEQANLLFCTEEEASVVLGLNGDPENVVRKAARLCGDGTVVLTMDDGGAILWHEGEVHRQAGYPLEVLDRVGAGDAFVAGFLCGFLERGAEAGLSYAAAYAALKHSFHGDVAWSTRDDLDQLIQEAQPPWR
jgi:2-dehydro-3-deoxygluconokinase